MSGALEEQQVTLAEAYQELFSIVKKETIFAQKCYEAAAANYENACMRPIKYPHETTNPDYHMRNIQRCLPLLINMGKEREKWNKILELMELEKEFHERLLEAR